MKNKVLSRIIPILTVLVIFMCGCTNANYTIQNNLTDNQTEKSEIAIVNIDSSEEFDFELIPEFNKNPYVIINNNIPNFKQSDYTTVSFENYGNLDELGRCTMCLACIGSDIMPTEERGTIGSIKPTGWHTVKYDCVDGKYLYNRCHLIGYQLTGENANVKNLITGTRYLNVEGMLPFEDMVNDYIDSTDNHVLYRVTPLFKDNELVARGVQIEGYSVEDNGEGICFNVYCYNNQPNITINYATGESQLTDSIDNAYDDGTTGVYIVNTKTHKFHSKDCSSVSNISEDNKKKYSGARSNLIANGYEPCKICNP